MLKTANRMFVDKKFSLDRSFKDKVGTYMKSQPDQIDFLSKPEDCRNFINEWVEQHTERKIKDLLPQGTVTSATKMVLVNAIYFKSTWLYKFEEKNTVANGSFHLPSGQVVPAQMMNLQANLSVKNLGTVGQVLRLPYAGNRVSMFIALPHQDHKIHHVEDYLGKPAL